MNLPDFNLDEGIFIDSNIFCYHFDSNSEYQQTCTEFLKRVERKEVKGIISDIVIDEVVYVLLIQKGSELLATDKIKKIKQAIKEEKAIANKCYEMAYNFYDYLEILRLAGVKIIEVDFDMAKSSLDIGKQECLLPHDAINATICKTFGIKNIATTDTDLEKIDFLRIWKP